MKLEFLLSTTQPSDEVAQWFCDLLTNLRDQMKVPDGALERVIIADPERFGDALAQVGKDQSYTNKHTLLAVGKTIAHRKGDGEGCSSSVILLDRVITQAVIAARTKGPDVTTWTAEERRCLYVPFHEFGHVIDHWFRLPINHDGTVRDEQGRRGIGTKLADACAYHVSMALDELPTCVFCADAYPDCVRQLDLEMNNTAFLAMAKAVAAKGDAHDLDLSEVRHTALGVVGFVLMQQAKLAGAAIGNPDLPPLTVREAWKCARYSAQLEEGIQMADEFFHETWKEYPKWDGHLIAKRIQPVVEAIGLGIGYKFQDLLGRDGVWWGDVRDSLLAQIDDGSDAADMEEA